VIVDKHILSEILDDKLEKFVAPMYAKIAELEAELEKRSIDYLHTVDEAKERLKCDESTLYRWREKGVLKAHAIGSRIYFKESSIQEALVEILPKKKRL
jgi:excisionase family DNA binding protein